MDKEYIEQILVEYGVAFTDCLADRLLKEFQAKEEINQSLLYENERLLKSVQEIKEEIENKRKFYSLVIDDGDYNVAFGLELALDIINEHMNWEGEDV